VIFLSQVIFPIITQNSSNYTTIHKKDLEHINFIEKGDEDLRSFLKVFKCHDIGLLGYAWDDSVFNNFYRIKIKNNKNKFNQNNFHLQLRPSSID